MESAAISQGTVQTPNGDTNAHQAQDDPEMKDVPDMMMDEDQDSKKDTTFLTTKKFLHPYIYLFCQLSDTVQKILHRFLP